MAEKEEKKKGGEGAAKKKKGFKEYKKHRSCPKCGPGVRLAEHSDRLSCGRCGYFERR